MMLELLEPNTCVRGCCQSEKNPLHLRPSSFSLLSPIARGAESVVYEATLDGERVAAKKPVLSTADDLDKFHYQLQLMWYLNHQSCVFILFYLRKAKMLMRVGLVIGSMLDHPGLAMLKAAHARPPGYLFLFPLYERGNLAEKIHAEEWNPKIHVAVGLALTLANALQYLHGLGIVHRDVKPANILLDRYLQPHLADFGLAAHKKDLKRVSAENWRSSGKPTGGFHKKNMVGTLIYMAPEILKKDVHTEKSDVYSFGISLNELLTGVVPYTDIRAEAQAHTVLEMNYTEHQLTAAIVSQGLRPILAGLESGAPLAILSLIQKCWDPDPSSRPFFDEIAKELESMMNELANVDTGQCLGVSGLPVTDEQQFDATHQPKFIDKINWFNQGEAVSNGHCLNFLQWAKSFSSVSTYRPVLSWGSFATCGRREAMEDTHFLHPEMSDNNDVHLFGIFDGHRGAAAAEFCVQALPGFLETLDSATSPAEALSQAFVKTDMAFRIELSNHLKFNKFVKKDWHPGCTASAVLIVKDTIFVANAGDCRTIICRGGRPYALSKDHVACCPEERERVTKAGGLVKWQFDTWRVGAAALQVTRSIGDDDLKPEVTAEPDITETLLSVEDEYLVMASDGLWDVMSNEEVVSIIRDTVKEPGMCSKRLATEAAERGSNDNITVIVVFLRPVSTSERIY